jgi:hypothetical protein
MELEEGGRIVERLGKTTKNLNPDFKSNQVPPKLKSRTLPHLQLAWFKSEQKFQLRFKSITFEV